MKKDEIILKLFFNEPTKHWHFEEILKSAKISRPQADRWLKNFLKEDIIKRVKPLGKMPYHIGNCESPVYQSRKRLFALNSLEQQGFLSHLAGLKSAQAVILFGSLSRWDWDTDSDIDLFFFGGTEGFDKGKFRVKLHREIETFVCKDKKGIDNMKPGLLRNIVEGYLVKGSLDFLEVKNA